MRRIVWNKRRKQSSILGDKKIDLHELTNVMAVDPALIASHCFFAKMLRTGGSHDVGSIFYAGGRMLTDVSVRALFSRQYSRSSSELFSLRFPILGKAPVSLDHKERPETALHFCVWVRLCLFACPFAWLPSFLHWRCVMVYHNMQRLVTRTGWIAFLKFFFEDDNVGTPWY